MHKIIFVGGIFLIGCIGEPFRAAEESDSGLNISRPDVSREFEPDSSDAKSDAVIDAAIDIIIIDAIVDIAIDVSCNNHCCNHIQDESETDIDCGGTCSTKCESSKNCNFPNDCQSNKCNLGRCQ